MANMMRLNKLRWQKGNLIYANCRTSVSRPDKWISDTFAQEYFRSPAV